MGLKEARVEFVNEIKGIRVNFMDFFAKDERVQENENVDATGGDTSDSSNGSKKTSGLQTLEYVQQSMQKLASAILEGKKEFFAERKVVTKGKEQGKEQGKE